MPPRSRNNSSNDKLDCLDEMKDWGFLATRCTLCGIHNSELSGALLQCAKCKRAHYCGMKCFNADLPNHVKFCQTGKLEGRVPQGFCKFIDDQEEQPPAEDSANRDLKATNGDDEKKKKKRRSKSKSRRRSKSRSSRRRSKSSKRRTKDESNAAEATDKANPEPARACDVPLQEQADEKEPSVTQQKPLLVLQLEEIEEVDESTTYPLHLSIDTEEVQETDEVIALWLTPADEEDADPEPKLNWSPVDPEEQVEIVHAAEGSAQIPPEEETNDDEASVADATASEASQLARKDHDHDFAFGSKPALIPMEDSFAQEQLFLFPTETNANKQEEGNWSTPPPVWESTRCSLRSAMPSTVESQGSPVSVAKRSLRSTIARSKETQRTEEDWVSQSARLRSAVKTVQAASAAARAMAATNNAIRLYRRVPREENDDVGAEEEQAQFRRLPLRPVGIRTTSTPPSADEGEQSLARESGRSPLVSPETMPRPSLSSKDTSFLDMSLRTTVHEPKPSLTSPQPSWVVDQEKLLKRTGRREKLVAAATASSIMLCKSPGRSPRRAAHRFVGRRGESMSALIAASPNSVLFDVAAGEGRPRANSSRPWREDDKEKWSTPRLCLHSQAA